ncbi:hypothetical protein QQ045_024417 [Rhodiola kirilowii]
MIEMRQREPLPLAFRTPQHPSLGTNNWGGASPLLARDLTKESLEQRYTRLNITRMRDEIFPSNFEDFVTKESLAPTPRRKSGAFVTSLIFFRKKAQLGSRRKRWSFPKWDPKNRWPQGW